MDRNQFSHLISLDFFINVKEASPFYFVPQMKKGKNIKKKYSK
jgi:hypothetical protein